MKTVAALVEGRPPDCDACSIVETLTQVKGIGRWTAQMLLRFGECDVYYEYSALRERLQEISA